MKSITARRTYRKRKPSAAAPLQGFELPAAQVRELRKWKRERWENLFLFQCRALKLPPVTREHRFALSIGRQWRFDFAFIAYRVAVEIEGIVVHGSGAAARFGFGRHHSVAGFLEDMRKYNAAALFGWSLLRFDQKTLKSGEAIDQTADLLRSKGWSGRSDLDSLAMVPLRRAP